MSNKFETDVCVIGAGPVGLFAVFQCGMLGMKSHVVDALEFVGGQCTALYPEKPIYDIPAFPSVNADDLIENLKKQAEPFEPQYHLNQQVIELKEEFLGEEKLFKLKTSTGNEITAKVVIIAAGCGAFGPNRPPLENLSEYENIGSVAYLIRSKKQYEGKKVIIAGGGDSAVDWANILANVAEKTYVLHRRDKFRAMDESVSQMRKLADEGKIEFLIPYQLDSLSGKDGVLGTVNIKDFDGNVKSVEADNLLCFYGLAMELGPIANWGLNINMKHISVDPSNCQTNIEGVYAIGDICDYKGKLKLITCGFSEGAMAAHHAYERVTGKTLHFEYSTTKGVPAE